MLTAAPYPKTSSCHPGSGSRQLGVSTGHSRDPGGGRGTKATGAWLKYLDLSWEAKTKEALQELIILMTSGTNHWVWWCLRCANASSFPHNIIRETNYDILWLWLHFLKLDLTNYYLYMILYPFRLTILSFWQTYKRLYTGIPISNHKCNQL